MYLELALSRMQNHSCSSCKAHQLIAKGRHIRTMRLKLPPLTIGVPFISGWKARVPGGAQSQVVAVLADSIQRKDRGVRDYDACLDSVVPKSVSSGIKEDDR